jgi:hypothetical protein
MRILFLLLLEAAVIPLGDAAPAARDGGVSAKELAAQKDILANHKQQEEFKEGDKTVEYVVMAPECPPGIEVPYCPCGVVMKGKCPTEKCHPCTTKHPPHADSQNGAGNAGVPAGGREQLSARYAKALQRARAAAAKMGKNFDPAKSDQELAKYEKETLSGGGGRGGKGEAAAKEIAADARNAAQEAAADLAHAPAAPSAPHKPRIGQVDRAHAHVTRHRAGAASASAAAPGAAPPKPVEWWDGPLVIPVGAALSMLCGALGMCVAGCFSKEQARYRVRNKEGKGKKDKQRYSRVAHSDRDE